MNTDGTVASGFESVRAAFVRNFEHHGEVGARFCAIHAGRTVVDLWGGLAVPETNAPWTADTVAPIASAGKGLTTMCAAVLVDRGLLDVDAPVASYWPEFAQAGKESIPVRWILSHRAGVAGLDTPATIDDVEAWDPFVEALARQAPLWEPGTRYMYHAMTFGHLIGEIIRRIDGRRPGQFFDEEIGTPRGLSAWIRLPEGQRIAVAPAIPASSPPEGAPRPTPDGPLGKIVTLDRPTPPDRMLSVEFPGGGYASARGLAGAYAAVAGFDASPLLSDHTVELFTADQEDVRMLGDGTSPSLRWGLGFALPSPATRNWLRSRGSFGHPGAGGALGYADRMHGLAVGYVPNKMFPGLGGLNDPRSTALLDALYAAVEVAQH